MLITTPDPVFKELSREDFSNEWADIIVMDFWRLLREKLEGKPGIKYLAVGLGQDDAASTKRLKSLWWGDEDTFGRSAE